LFECYVKILVAVLCYEYSATLGAFPAIILCLIFIQSAQRGINVLMHDTHHENQREPREYLRFLIAAPLNEDYTNYNKSHWIHHEKLSTIEDPDHGFGNASALEHYHSDSKNYTEARDLNFFRAFIGDAFNLQTWKSNAIGPFTSIGWPSKIIAILWWVVMCASIRALHSRIPSAVHPSLPSSFLAFPVLWYLSRATLYHFISVFREMGDHSGLIAPKGVNQQELIYAYTRTLPGGLLSEFFMCPYNDRFHLLHHLKKGIPLARLAEVHESECRTNEKYRKSHICDGFIFGKHTVLSCIQGSCQQD